MPRLVSFLAVVLLAGVGAAVWLSWAPRSLDVRTAGLSGPVTVRFDTNGVPRIAAATLDDAAAGLGAAHARDRMFQMELMRRAASGQLSEIAGARTLPLDRMARTLGLRRRAEEDLRTLPPEVRRRLEAYAAGVNAVIAARGRWASPENAVLGRPEPWTPVDSLLWGKTMAMWLSGNWRTEIARAGLAGRLPPDRIRELWPGQTSPANSDALYLPGLDAVMRRLAALPSFPDPFTMPATASNEWAVDGRQSAGGAPLLAGDPHLQFSLPGIWYLARIELPGRVLAGATSPGVPFIVIGHNGKVSWTFTTTGADTQDVFVETLLPDGRYASPAGPQAFTTRQERIGVRGLPDEVLGVRESRHGPVVDGLVPGGNAAPGYALAVAMASLLPGDTSAAGLLALNDAEDVEAAGRAAGLIAAPVQNLLLADRERIALFTTGRIPIRRAGDGSLPVDGASGAYDWTGVAGGRELPHVVAPESGRLVNANEPVRLSEEQVFAGVDAFGDWRARRIRELLSRPGKRTPEEFAAMQVDAVSEYARDLLPILRAAPVSEGLPARAKALLDQWDGAMLPDLPQPLLFNAWLRQFEAAVLHRAGATPVGPWTEFVRHVLSPGGARWCDGDCGPLLGKALADACATLATRYGQDPASWRWGDAHRAVFGHPLLGGLFAARIEQPGDDTTVYRGSARARTFESVHGAGLRVVFDHAELEGSRFIVAPGQSGNLLDPAARSMLERWRDGKGVQLGPSRARPSATLSLSP